MIFFRVINRFFYGFKHAKCIIPIIFFSVENILFTSLELVQSTLYHFIFLPIILLIPLILSILELHKLSKIIGVYPEL